MKTIARWTEPPAPCVYVSKHNCTLDYMIVAKMDPDEYMAHLLDGMAAVWIHPLSPELLR